jgi:ribonuclease-3
MSERAPGVEEEPRAACERRLGYRFRDAALLRAALTHASVADHRLASNERLEFLGDSILGAVVCDRLYREFPESLEGSLTRIKSVVVSRRTCAKVSRRLGLDEFLILGKGMGSPDQTPDSVLAAVFEALIGAMYLDGGMEAARAFIERELRGEIEAAAVDQGGQNFKSGLQQSSQRQFGETPTYLLLDEKGPDHSKCFKVAAQIGDQRFAAAWGPNKKDAEQRAARNALCQMAGDPPPFQAD